MNCLGVILMEERAWWQMEPRARAKLEKQLARKETAARASAAAAGPGAGAAAASPLSAAAAAATGETTAAMKKKKAAAAPALATGPPIYFYEKTAPYYQFTNFYPAPLRLDDAIWPTSEHFFQAQKFSQRPDLMQRILEMKEASHVFTFAQEHKDLWPKVRAGLCCVCGHCGGDLVVWCTQDWHERKDNVMRRAVRAKFKDNYRDLGKLLLDTGDRLLVERTTKDKYWADGGDGTGKNMLGRILMEERDWWRLTAKERKQREKEATAAAKSTQ